jgi:hypothetical protein
MEIVFAVSMDQVIAAAIRLDDTQVGGLLEGIEPATPAPAPEPMAASSSAASKTSEDRPEAGA